MGAVSVGLEVGLEIIMWPSLGLEKFLCPWPRPSEKTLGLDLGLVNRVYDNKTAINRN